MAIARRHAPAYACEPLRGNLKTLLGSLRNLYLYLGILGTLGTFTWGPWNLYLGTLGTFTWEPWEPLLGNLGNLYLGTLGTFTWEPWEPWEKSVSELLRSAPKPLLWLKTPKLLLLGKKMVILKLCQQPQMLRGVVYDTLMRPPRSRANSMGLLNIIAEQS